MSKHGKNHPSTHTKNPEGEEKSTKRHVYIEPGVQIDVVQDLKEQHETERKEDAATHKKQSFWTKVAAVLVFIYTAVAGWQLKVARDTFNATNRPYVGVTEIRVVHDGVDAKGQKVRSSTPTPETTSLSFGIVIKNVGPVPGRNFNPTIKILLGGIEQPLDNTFTSEGITLFPGADYTIPEHLGTTDYPPVMAGKKILEVELRFGYDGPGDHYAECDRERWLPNMNRFGRLSCK